ncbi:DNA polymerase-3 subunit epsilon [Asanoa ishikariensis]|uniref:DNA polymerase-3 subunit epsilon n=2 Tax=Asanoa ishikariensis TaxID=137265 RepID=A0A1H3USU6_9ACTN|nr:DNA polymerase-3 subunit epsilon [Asanoa ishikariensis]
MMGSVRLKLSEEDHLTGGAVVDLVPEPVMEANALGSLTADPAFRSTTYVVIDFEATTPTGYPSQPIEIAVLALRYGDGGWRETGRSTSLIRPPAFAPVTPADTAQTGLTAAQLSAAPTPSLALGAVDRRFADGTPYLLVAQHAATEANLIHNQQEHCPTLARIDFLDTIPLAKYCVPGLTNYRLDTLLAHFSIAQPADRHRATADVDVTAQVFRRLINLADDGGSIGNLASLVKIAGRRAKANLPRQVGLFELPPTASTKGTRPSWKDGARQDE